MSKLVHFFVFMFVWLLFCAFCEYVLFDDFNPWILSAGYFVGNICFYAADSISNKFK